MMHAERHPQGVGVHSAMVCQRRYGSGASKLSLLLVLLINHELVFQALVERDGKLAAGPVDLLAAGTATGVVDVQAIEQKGEVVDLLFGRTLEGKLLSGVPGDEIDDDIHVLDIGGELFGAELVGVDTAKHAILDGETFSTKALVVYQGSLQGHDVPLLVHRHDTVTRAIVSSHQRDGKLDGKFLLSEFEDAGHHTTGGDGDAPETDVVGILFVEIADGAGDCCDVGKRFAHSHIDDVRDGLVAHPKQMDILLDDLFCTEIAQKAHRASSAEGASHCTTYLAGEACSVPSLLVDEQHAFDNFSVMQADAHLGRPTLVAFAGLDGGG
ncbi:hypothetical protein SDC9_74909 [bioreactor metagenome]|uniref:Uncharacterized protein n=1 Tax=bioreactor metagenome TaxID=1076179 RepID=A0A644YJB8_9ZZZZ